MKVFVVISHLEYEYVLPETIVEGVFDTLEKAQEEMCIVFNKQLELKWGDISEDDREYKTTSNEKSVYDLVDGNYIKIEIWEKELV